MYGSLIVVCGPMASGKTEELIRRITRENIAKRRTILFKPKIDTRNPENYTISRNGQRLEAKSVNSPEEIISFLENIEKSNSEPPIQVIGIDEAHFFEKYQLQRVTRILLMNGKKVIVAGLDQDFLGEPFETITYLMGIADKVLKLSAICVICGQDATMTQKTINGKPASRKSPRIEIGGDEKYFPVCHNCHIIPDQY